jgi:hypothetical protein
VSEYYSDAPYSLRLSRLVSKNPEMVREVSASMMSEFDSQLDSHLSGLYMKSEVQAGAVRLYLMYREVESLVGRSGDFHSFARTINEDSNMVFNYLRGASGKTRYTSDQLHGWSCLLTKRWLSDGYQVHVLLHPNGVIEPLVSEIKVGTPDIPGTK